MDFSFLELLFDSCNDDLNFINHKSTELEQAFFNKYIESELRKENNEYGIEMEENFSAAIADISLREFKNGFRTCLRFILEGSSDNYDLRTMV